MVHPVIDDENAWRAEAVRGRVLRRLLPAQRHDGLGPLSAIKMLLAVARRRLTTTAPDGAGLAAMVDDLIDQQRAAQKALVAMRLWDEVAAASSPWPVVVQEVCAWVGAAATMQGHRLLAPESGSGDSAREVAVPDAHYMLAAFLLSAVDTAACPMRMTLTLDPAEGAAAVVLDLSPRTGEGEADPGLAGPPDGTHGARALRRRIGPADVLALAATMDATVVFEGSQAQDAGAAAAAGAVWRLGLP